MSVFETSKKMSLWHAPHPEKWLFVISFKDNSALSQS